MSVMVGVYCLVSKGKERMYNRQYIVLTKGVSSVSIKQKRTAETNKLLQDKKRARWQVGEVEVQRNESRRRESSPGRDREGNRWKGKALCQCA